jgi:hypothetical protein
MDIYEGEWQELASDESGSSDEGFRPHMAREDFKNFI